MWLAGAFQGSVLREMGSSHHMPVENGEGAKERGREGEMDRERERERGRGGERERGRGREGEMERGRGGERERWREGESERGREREKLRLLALLFLHMYIPSCVRIEMVATSYSKYRNAVH